MNDKYDLNAEILSVPFWMTSLLQKLSISVSVYLEARVKPVRVGEMPVLLIPVSSTANEIPDICWYKAREKGTKGRILLLI